MHYSSYFWNSAGMSEGAELHEQFARIGKALASPRRIELLELLCQSERSVEELARATGMTVTNASQHLQVLRSAGLVTTHRDGTKVICEVADDDVARFFEGLRDLARGRLAEVELILQRHFDGTGELEPVSRDELRLRVERDGVVVLDVRPVEEYRSGHIPGAVSVPLGELEQHLARLPRDVEIVAYCRGPYCLLAPQAVMTLRRHGLRARRLADGLPEWRRAGLPVTVGERP
jgi:rhodanese-related sulfurtransferase/DNA-binding transcriptional ArsR family regulator